MASPTNSVLGTKRNDRKFPAPHAESAANEKVAPTNRAQGPAGSPRVVGIDPAPHLQPQFFSCHL
jgi:hypothetical protein